MSIFKKTGYLRVLFVGLPFGIGALIVGIPMFKEIPKIPNDLEFHKGVLSSFGDTTYYDKEIDLEFETFYIRLNSNTYFTDRRKEREVIESHNYSVGDTVTVWTEPDDVYIKQLVANNQMVMNYQPPYWMAWFFTLAGIVFTTMSLFYLIKYSSDYFGSQKPEN
ncbi:MAG: hypothetical protein ACQETL_20005 [Bacteroidota bacterium]